MAQFEADDIDPNHVDFRGLWENMMEYEGQSLYHEVIAPWLEENGAGAAGWLAAFAARRGDPIPGASHKDLSDLYAFSRVYEALLRRVQPSLMGSSRDGDATAPLSISEYNNLITAFGLQMIKVDEFSPFFHEIVSVEQHDDENAPLTIRQTLWPAVILGEMLFARAGVVVRGGRNHVVKEIAEQSTLYWASYRNHRPRADMSDGWGSNSQWRTTFRRDYLIDGKFFYHVDGKNNLALPQTEEDRDGLTPAARLELLLNRCLIKTPAPHNDLWPYDDTYQCDAIF
jgi:hypothetical protein